MIARVFGKTDGLEIVFVHLEGDKWNVVIPRNALGQYYLDLYAEDEAGNTSFMAKALFEVDPFSLCCNIAVFESDKHFSLKADSDFEFLCKEVRCI